MVDVRAKTLPRCVDEESEPRPHVALRRFQRGLGCHLGQPSAFRSLVSVRKKYAYQQPRTVGYPESSSVCRRIGKRENRGNFLRQHLSSVLYSVEGGARSLDLYLLVREILLWTEELEITLLPQFIQGSRNVLADCLRREKPDNSYIVVSPSLSVSQNLEAMGSANGGSFCHFNDPSSSSLYESSAGPSGYCRRCNAPALGRPFCICVSTIQPNKY